METQPKLDYPDRPPPKKIALAEMPRPKPSEPKVVYKRKFRWWLVVALIVALVVYYLTGGKL